MPSVIPSPEVRWLSECHCRCLWDDPACFHPSQPPMAARWKARGEWSFKHSITATFEGCQERKNPQRRRFMFYVFFCRRKETRRGEDLLQNRFVCVDAGIVGFYHPCQTMHLHIHSAVWWPSVTTSKPVLMALMKMCHSHVFGAGHREPLSAERRQGDATGRCCVTL